MASATQELSDRAELMAAGIFVLLAGGFVAITITYPPTDRLLPLVVGVPTLVLSVLVFLSYLSPAVRSFVDRFEFDALDTEESLSTEAPALPANPYVEPIAWVLLLFGAGILFGLVVVAPVYVYFFITRYGGKRRSVAAAVGLAATGVFVFLFEFILGAPLYSGLLTEYLVDLLA